MQTEDLEGAEPAAGGQLGRGITGTACVGGVLRKPPRAARRAGAIRLRGDLRIAGVRARIRDAFRLGSELQGVVKQRLGPGPAAWRRHALPPRSSR